MQGDFHGSPNDHTSAVDAANCGEFTGGGGWTILLFGSLLTALVTVGLISLSVAGSPASPTTAKTAWDAHHEWCRSFPDELYRRDRFRAVRGRVTDGDGKPVSGALVQCVCLDAYVALAEAGGMSSDRWRVPVETETRADADGAYVFPHLPVGARTFFYSAPGRDLAPAVRELIVVQDGLGATLDVVLDTPTILRVRFDVPMTTDQRLHLVPHRWWPTVPSQVVKAGETMVEFRGLGGPFRKGLMVADDPRGSTPWRVVGHYDLDVSAKAVVSRPGPIPPRFVLPEAAGLESWHDGVSESERLFYTAFSPVALFLPDPRFVALLRLLEADYTTLVRQPVVADFPPMKPDATGTARGFGPQPFLPVLVESRAGGSWLSWTSEASEFEVAGLPTGPYRVRALDLFGRVTFARGEYVPPESIASLATNLHQTVDQAEPESREVMGFVRWESGTPAAKAVVFMQHSGNFRLFLRRVETDEHGYFHFVGVPGNMPYFAFALPPDSTSAVKEIQYFAVPDAQRERWLDLTLHPHQVKGRAIDADSNSSYQLVRMNAEQKEEVIVSTFRADPSGEFALANVPHGHYTLRSSPGRDGKTSRSQPFEVGDGRSEVAVDWLTP